MRRISVILGLSLLMVAACGDDDDDSPEHGDHDHDGASGSGGSRAGSGGKGGAGGSASAGRGGSQATAGSAAGGRGGAPAAAGAGGSSSGDQDVTIRFKAKVGSKDFACGQTYSGIGSKSSTVTPMDFRFFVEDIKLVDGDREVPVKIKARAPWQSDTLALLDFEDGSGSCVEGNPEKNLVIEGTVPKGDYSAIIFTNGVPDAENHGDPVTAKDPLKTYASLTWGWLFGFRFMKVEAQLVTTDVDMDAGAVPFSWLHLGAGECTNQALEDAGMDFEKPPIACALPYLNRIKLTHYKVGESVIVADLVPIFAQTDITAMEGCHGSGAPCVSMWKAVGLDDQGKALSTQSVYSLE